jgi:pimeloyl-ACP methyl ester carboxylesterase
VRAISVSAGCLLTLGCADLQYYIPAINCGATNVPNVQTLKEIGTAEICAASGVADADWLSLPRRAAGGAIGGFLSREAGPRGSLAILITGAGTLYSDARVTGALRFYREYGGLFQDRGFRVLSLVQPEDAPYATREVDDLVELLTWLDAEGKALLGVRNVFVIGYSTGATTASFANLRAAANAYVCVATLTGPQQLQRSVEAYRGFADLFGCNTGFAQLALTIDYYEAVGWHAFDLVSRVAELTSPALYMAAEDDSIYEPQNARRLEAAYCAALDAGLAPPELTFEYAPRGGHFVYVTDRRYFEPVLEFVERHESR